MNTQVLQSPPAAARWRDALPVAIEGSGFAIPFSVGSITLLFARISPELMAPGMLAAMLGMVLMHLAAAGKGRPMVYAVRVLEVSMLVGFLDQFILKMPGWGLADTPAHRLMLVMAVSVGAALLLPLCFALQLQRFARMIPAPVFAGFSTALGLTLLISQSATLWNSMPGDGFWFIGVALVVTVVSVATRQYARRLPPGVMGLLAGLLVSVLLAVTGAHALAVVMQSGLVMALPVTLVPWHDAFAAGVDTSSILRDVVLASATLAALVFLNTVVSEEATSQLDDARPRPRDWMRTSAAMLASCIFGSPVLTPSVGASRAAVSVGVLNWRALCLVAAMIVVVVGSGVMRLVPLAAISGLLLFDAWSNFDRPSLRMAWLWLRGRRPALTEREDLATIAIVVASSVLFNLVTGVAVGVFAGLVLYAWRNGRRLARTVATGAELRSNCARSRNDVALLNEQAQRVRFIALEGALFFGAASALQALLREQSAPGRYIVVDWSHVVSADSTIASAFARVAAEARAAGASFAVSGLDAAGRQVGETMLAGNLQADVFPDADRALEWAENEVLRTSTPTLAMEGTSLQEALSLFRGLSNEHRTAIEGALEQRFYRSGDTVFTAGQVDSELMVILQGCVDILVPHSEGRDVRLARIRRGGMLGELSFLDRAPRAATAVATEDLLLGVMSRERFENFARDNPEAGRRVLTNLALDLAFRMRRTNHMAVNSLR
ncbi:MAG: cyclic nucleotide-binding domain-containing protein [Comamonadaceae bacterium]|nr:MAG: cyclic nucleotide-binding domain-containing protein [Comamonadaceae bacterium]